MLQGSEHGEEVRVPRVVGNALIVRGKRLIPFLNGSSIDNGGLEFGEELIEDAADVVRPNVEHGVVQMKVLVASDIRDVDGTSVLVLGDLTLHDHRTDVSGVVVIVQFPNQGYAIAGSVESGAVVVPAVLYEYAKYSAA